MCARPKRRGGHARSAAVHVHALVREAGVLAAIARLRCFVDLEKSCFLRSSDLLNSFARRPRRGREHAGAWMLA